MKRIVAVIVFAMVIAWLVARGEIGSGLTARHALTR